MTELEQAALDYRSALEALRAARKNRENAEKLIAGCQANEDAARELVMRAKQTVVRLAAGDQQQDSEWPAFGFYAQTTPGV